MQGKVNSCKENEIQVFGCAMENSPENDFRCLVTFSQPFSWHSNKFYYRKFQYIHLTQPKIKIKTLSKRKKE